MGAIGVGGLKMRIHKCRREEPVSVPTTAFWIPRAIFLGNCCMSPVMDRIVAKIRDFGVTAAGSVRFP